MPRFRNLQTRERGQNLVEITLLLPILLLTFLGMVEVGWWTHSFVTVATAAREGARFGSRGLHLSTSEIADVTKVAMDSSIYIDLTAPDANTAIIVTEIDLDPDGSYTVHDTYKLGDLIATSEICLDDPCLKGSIDLKIVRDENVDFNNNVELCTDANGCRNDLVIVEIFHNHDLVLAVPILADVLPNPIRLKAEGVMRVLVRRSPWS